MKPPTLATGPTVLESGIMCTFSLLTVHKISARSNGESRGPRIDKDKGSKSQAGRP